MTITYEEAQQVLKNVAVEHARFTAQRDEIVSILDAVGRVSNEEVISKIATPGFDSSAMEGYAVSSNRTSGASPSHPLVFCVKGCMAAGDAAKTVQGVDDDHFPPCVEIMTGAQFPKPTTDHSFDACVRVEDTRPALGPRSDLRYVSITAPVRRDQNRRYAGSDVQVGDVVVTKGDVIHAQHVMALASLGVPTISARRKLRVGVWSTGSELVSYEAGGDHHDCIRNSNGPFLVSSLGASGLEVDDLGIIQDNATDLVHAVRKRAGHEQYDVLITTGAVSVGKFDIVPESLRQLGATVRFHKVAMRPGAPILFATLWRTQSGLDLVRSTSETPLTAFFGLPGNPMATAIGFRLFVLPYLQMLAGRRPDPPLYAKACLQDPRTSRSHGDDTETLPHPRPFTKPEHLDVFRHGYLDHTLKGTEVVMNDDQASSKVKPWLSADCWVHVPRGVRQVTDGDTLACIRFSP